MSILLKLICFSSSYFIPSLMTIHLSYPVIDRILLPSILICVAAWWGRDRLKVSLIWTNKNLWFVFISISSSSRIESLVCRRDIWWKVLSAEFSSVAVGFVSILLDMKNFRLIYFVTDCFSQNCSNRILTHGKFKCKILKCTNLKMFTERGWGVAGFCSRSLYWGNRNVS